MMMKYTNFTQKDFELLSEYYVETDDIESFMNLWDSYPEMADHFIKKTDALIALDTSPALTTSELDQEYEKFKQFVQTRLGPDSI